MMESIVRTTQQPCAIESKVSRSSHAEDMLAKHHEELYSSPTKVAPWSQAAWIKNAEGDSELPQHVAIPPGDLLFRQIQQLHDMGQHHTRLTSKSEECLQQFEKKLQKGLRAVEEPLEEALSHIVNGILKMAQLLGITGEHGWE